MHPVSVGTGRHVRRVRLGTGHHHHLALDWMLLLRILLMLTLFFVVRIRHPALKETHGDVLNVLEITALSSSAATLEICYRVH